MIAQESLKPKQENCVEIMHDWAETAVMRVKNLADCLTWQGNAQEQAEFLGGFVGELIDSRDVLTAQDTPFDFRIFAHAIDEPAVVFDYDWPPASFHHVAKDLIPALVVAIFPNRKPATITRQDAEKISTADIERIARALSDSTGHELEDTRERLLRLSSGLAKEYDRLGTKHFLPLLNEQSAATEVGRCIKNASSASGTPESTAPPPRGWQLVPGKAYYDGKEIPVKGIEWSLLNALVDTTRPLTIDKLCEAGWEHEQDVSPDAIRKHLSNLRRVLRRKLDVGYDPIPNVDRGRLAAWQLAAELRPS